MFINDLKIEGIKILPKDLNKKHVFIISCDAMIYDDLTILREDPVIDDLLNKSSIIKNVQTIYPSLTHPVHASITSGNFPNKTGIISNLVFKPGDLKRDWFSKYSDYKCKTMVDIAKENDLIVASCDWPLMEHAPIDYSICMSMVKENRDYDNPIKMFQSSGSSLCCMNIIEECLDKFGVVPEHPQYDEFISYGACEIIRRYKPNLLFSHPGNIDSFRHKYGIYSPEVDNEIRRTSRHLKALLKAIDDAGIKDETDIIIMSDHGHMDYERTCYPNSKLMEAGLIISSQDKLIDYKSYVVSNGMSGLVYIKDKKYEKETLEVLSKIDGISKIFTKLEAMKEGLDGVFDYVIETDGKTKFKEDIDKGLYEYNKEKHSEHGYHYSHGLPAVFIGYGPDFKKGIELESTHITNVAPTVMNIFGINYHCDGKVINDVLSISRNSNNY